MAVGFGDVLDWFTRPILNLGGGLADDKSELLVVVYHDCGPAVFCRDPVSRVMFIFFPVSTLELGPTQFFRKAAAQSLRKHLGEVSVVCPNAAE